MITYIRKEKERKELTMGKKICDSGQVSGVYEIIVYPRAAKDSSSSMQKREKPSKGRKKPFLRTTAS